MKLIIQSILCLTGAAAVLMVLSVIIAHPVRARSYAAVLGQDFRSLAHDSAPAVASETAEVIGPAMNAHPEKALPANLAEAEALRLRIDLEEAVAEGAELRGRYAKLRRSEAEHTRHTAEDLRVERARRLSQMEYTQDEYYRANGTNVRVDVHVRSDPPARWILPTYKDEVTRSWIEPVYKTVVDRQYEPPVYRTTSERVWHEPLYRTSSSRNFVPDEYEIRETVMDDCGCGGAHIERQRVLVAASHYENVAHQILVRDGWSEDVQVKVLMSEGGYREVKGQRLMTSGHFETRTTHVQVMPGHWASSD